MLWHGWLMHWSRFGGRGWGIGDGDDLKDADILPGVQEKRLWAVIMDGYPQFGAAGKCGNSSHKRRQSVFQTEVDVLGRPRVMAVDQPCGLCRDICGLEQQGTVRSVGSGERRAAERFLVAERVVAGERHPAVG